MRVTLKDIVEKTGVSKSVISMYLNKDPRVRLSEEKKKRIDSAVRELGYRPSFAACTLRKGRSRTLGLVLGGITNAYFSHLAEAALKYADDRGYQLLLSLTSWNPEKERRSLKSLIERQVDGIIYSPHLQPDPDYCRLIRETGIPILLPRQEIDGFLSVKTNWDEIFEKVAAFFAERGHRKIMYSVYFSDNRHELFREKCGKQGMETVPFLIGKSPETDLFQAILAERPDALFISDCRIVEQFLLWFRKQNKSRCPEIVTHYNFPVDFIEDPAVVGVVYEDFYKFVKNAIKLLIDCIETKNAEAAPNMDHIRYFYPMEEFIKQKDGLIDTLNKAEELEKK